MRQNSLAREQRSSEKEALNGQGDQISARSVFWFPVYEGIFEHCPKMLDAVWLFMWLIARTTYTSEWNGDGKVLGGIPIPDERIAGELGVSVKTVRRWRRVMVSGNYVVTVRTAYGFKYTLLKSKRKLKPTKRDCPKMPISLEENAQNGESDLPIPAVRLPETGSESAQSGNSNKTIQRQHRKKAEEDTATATPSTCLGTQNERYPEAWEDIEIEPCGTLKFALTWEQSWGDSKEGEPWSVVMERCIQKCQASKIQVPRLFYERKHRIEDTEEPEEIRRVAGLRGISPEHMR